MNSTRLTFNSSQIERAVLFEPRLVGRVGQDDLDLPKRLTHLELRGHPALRPSETISRTSAIRRKLRVDRRRIARWIVAKMDALGGWCCSRPGCLQADARPRLPGSATSPRPGTAQTGQSACRSSADIRRASNRRRALSARVADFSLLQNRSRLRRTYQLLRASTKPVSAAQASKLS